MYLAGGCGAYRYVSLCMYMYTHIRIYSGFQDPPQMSPLAMFFPPGLLSSKILCILTLGALKENLHPQQIDFAAHCPSQPRLIEREVSALTIHNAWGLVRLIHQQATTLHLVREGEASTYSVGTMYLLR